jgi:small subunit ribosomal protein S6
MVILSPMLSAAESGEAWTRIKDFITSHAVSGGLTHEQRMGTRRLAYPIRKSAHNFLEGNYHLARFSTETAITKELELFLRLDERVIRYLTVTTGAPKPTPEPALAPAAAAEREPVAAGAVAEPHTTPAEAAPAQPAVP